MSTFEGLVKETTEDFVDGHFEPVFSQDQTDGKTIYANKSFSKLTNIRGESNSKQLTELAIVTENVDNGGQLFPIDDTQKVQIVCDSTGFKEGPLSKKLSEVEVADSFQSEFTDDTDDICLPEDVVSSITNLLHDSENEMDESTKSEMLVRNKSADMEEMVLETQSNAVEDTPEPKEIFYRPKLFTEDLKEVKKNSDASQIGPFLDNRPICDCETVTRLMSNTDARFLLSLLPDIAEMSSRQKAAFKNRAIQLVDRVYTDTNND